MNTPFHMVVNTLILGKKENPSSLWYAMFGGLLPDAWLFLNAGIMAIFGREHLIETRAFISDMSHSIPLYVLLLFIAWKRKMSGLQIVVISALLHIALDIPVHVRDARPHLWPFSEGVWSSPISFWDPDFYGLPIGIMEGVLYVIFIVMAWRLSSNIKYRTVLFSISIIYFFVFWHFLGHMGFVPVIHH